MTSLNFNLKIPYLTYEMNITLGVFQILYLTKISLFVSCAITTNRISKLKTHLWQKKLSAMGLPESLAHAGMQNCQLWLQL